MVRTLCIWIILTVAGAIALLKLSLRTHPRKPDEFKPYDANYQSSFAGRRQNRTK